MWDKLKHVEQPLFLGGKLNPNFNGSWISKRYALKYYLKLTDKEIEDLDVS